MNIIDSMSLCTCTWLANSDCTLKFFLGFIGYRWVAGGGGRGVQRGEHWNYHAINCNFD